MIVDEDTSLRSDAQFLESRFGLDASGQPAFFKVLGEELEMDKQVERLLAFSKKHRQASLNDFARNELENHHKANIIRYQMTDVRRQINREVSNGEGNFFNILENVYGREIPDAIELSDAEIRDIEHVEVTAQHNKKFTGKNNGFEAAIKQDILNHRYATQDHNTDFKVIMDRISDMYSSQFSKNNAKVLIGPKDFALLSKFEKNTLRTVANIWGILDSGEDISYTDLVSIMNKLGEHKTDVEKSYLLSLFFPEKVKNIHTIYPFPIPTYSYSQKVQIFVTPNVNGCFLAQVVCPLLLDNVANAAASNVYINNNANLNGTTLGVAADFTPVQTTKTIPGAFNTYTLQCCKLSARYVGRGDVMSGYLGGSYNLSATSSMLPDISATQFNYVDDSINSVVAEITEGLNTVFYPPDVSYTNFLRVNNDNILGGQMSTNHRMNIYGSSLPPPALAGQSAGIILTFVAVWNVIPTPIYADLLPLNYNVHEKTLDLIDISKFLPQSGLAAYKNTDIGKLERMLNLPKSVRDNALQDHINKFTETKKGSILDVLDPLVGENIQRSIIVDRKFLEEFGPSALNERRKAVNTMALAKR